MKILQVIHSVAPEGGGTTEAVRQLSQELVRHGATVEVLSLDPPDAPFLRDFPVPVTALGPGGGRYGYASRAVPWLVRRADDFDFAVVNGLWQYGNLAVWRAARRTGLRYVVFPHGMLDPWFKHRYPLKHLKKWCYWPWAEYRVLRDARAVFFTSDQERKDARESFRRLYRCREQVIGLGIEPPPSEADAPAEIFLRKYPALAGRRLLLFLGRLHEKKGCDLLLRAYRESMGSGRAMGPHLVMAGPDDNPYAAGLRDLAADLGLTDRHVTWTGMLTGPLKWSAFRAADFFILPSHQENFGVSVVEALACRCPVLISDKVNIWREVVAEAAGLADRDDAAGTRRLVERWLGLRPADIARFRESAAACYERRYRISDMAAHFLERLETLKENR